MKGVAVSATDFSAWATPALVLTLGGRTYTVPAPSVDNAKYVLASALRGEVNLGLQDGPIPQDVSDLLAELKPGDHPALGNVHAQMVKDGIDQVSIDRMTYYAVFYWARGKEFADSLATILWMPRDVEPEADRSAPKD